MPPAPEPLSPKPRVLFLCVENSCRSQLAEALGRLAGLEAHSAGSKPSGQVNPLAVASMAELGYDLSAHRSKGVEALPDGEYDAAVTMGCGDSCAFVATRHKADWPIPDPKAMGPDGFRTVRDDIAQRVESLARQLGVRPKGAPRDGDGEADTAP